MQHEAFPRWRHIIVEHSDIDHGTRANGGGVGDGNGTSARLGDLEDREPPHPGGLAFGDGDVN